MTSTTINTPATTPNDRTKLDAAHQELERQIREAADEAHRKLEAGGALQTIAINVGANVDPAADAKAKAKAELDAAAAAHEPLHADDAQTGAVVKLKPGARVDTTIGALFGTIEGVVGKLIGPARGGLVNVGWPDGTWSQTALELLELVEGAVAIEPAKAKALEGRVASLESATAGIPKAFQDVNSWVSQLVDRVKALEDDKAARDARQKSASSDPAARFVKGSELDAALDRVKELEAKIKGILEAKAPSSSPPTA